ncbi:Lrp/AsnC ligand binding domain-containing protein [Candidatus Woesearchaeota archaeon]|nr:Lrp/AsnC ligand binding domain-containing protein [Candidatus Woesearchaeota archaeon]
MVKAYVLIQLEGIDASKAAKEITSIEEVENAHLLYGEYDIIAVVNTKTLVQLKELALSKISKVKGVAKTSSLIVADEE